MVLVSLFMGLVAATAFALREVMISKVSQTVQLQLMAFFELRVLILGSRSQISFRVTALNSNNNRCSFKNPVTKSPEGLNSNSAGVPDCTMRPLSIRQMRSPNS